MNNQPLDGIKPGTIINGNKAAWVSKRLFLNIFLHALKTKNNPLTIIRNLKKFAEKRTKIQGYSKITRFVHNGQKYHFADQIPGFPSGTFNRFFEAELKRVEGNRERKIMMNTVIYSITSRCLLKCTHCFEWDNLSSQEHLKPDQLITILEKLKTLGLTHIQFGGGEPLARFDDLLVLIKKAKTNMDCWLLTSGFGLTLEKALELKKAGLTGASISLDHWEEKAHNAFRNHEKSFYWVKEAVQNCHRAGIILSLALCATKEFTTQENILKYYELAKAWNVGFIKILEARKVGRFTGKDVTLTPEQIEMLTNFYLKSYSDDKFRNWPIVMFPGFDQRQVGCLGAGNRYLYIDSKGEIHACPFCQNPVGNALDITFEDAIKKLRNTGCQKFPLSSF
ncbi:MAG: radical SAM protein [Mariniphaga sp.]|nr:radical SAM protein [Mariniphaga sp.]